MSAAAASSSEGDEASRETRETQAIFGCELIQQMGILLKLPQVAVSTACVSFHRFYARRSMHKFDVRYIALGSLFLATKVEESPRKLRDILQVFVHLEQKRMGTTPTPVDIHSNRFTAYKERLIRAERELLKELGFILYTEHPHKFILNYCKLLTLDETTLKRLAQYAWNFINDSQRTDVCMRFPPETICCAALWMGARVLQIKLPSSMPHSETDAPGDLMPPWWELFDAKKEDMDAVCTRVSALYSRPPATFVDLQQTTPAAAAASS